MGAVDVNAGVVRRHRHRSGCQARQPMAAAAQRAVGRGAAGGGAQVGGARGVAGDHAGRPVRQLQRVRRRRLRQPQPLRRPPAAATLAAGWPGTMPSRSMAFDLVRVCTAPNTNGAQSNRERLRIDCDQGS